MTLSDLRRVTVKKRLRIRFALSNGMECIVNEHGVAQVPALRAVPAFNLEEELAITQRFVVEAAAAGEKDRRQTKPRSCTRDEMLALATDGAGGEPGHEEHDE
ncbi:MAG: hypothetical protein ABSH50_05250 [Bryobacteraceae bacterium]